MAVTARRALILSLLFCTMIMRADDSANIHEVIGDMANALSAGDAAQAISFVSKKCENYDRLMKQFDAVTGAYYVENHIEFSDEDLAQTQATISLRWDMALTTKQSAFVKNRSAEIKIKLAREGKHWKIIDLSPADFFDPQDK